MFCLPEDWQLISVLAFSSLQAVMGLVSIMLSLEEGPGWLGIWGVVFPRLSYRKELV